MNTTPAANSFATNTTAEAFTQTFAGLYNSMADYYTANPPQTYASGAVDLATLL